jgi:diguanylate cyclase (GGDEF)-like protein/PAS domain S-box-containing protein
MSVKPADPRLRKLSEVVNDPARQAALFHAFPSLVWCADGMGGVSFVNQAWKDFTGRSLANEKGKGWLESVHPDDRAGVERAWTEALGLRRSFELEYRLRRADGEYGWVMHSANPVTDDDGRLTGYLGTCHDISERRNAELFARAREQEVRLLADNVPVLIAYFAADDLKCVFANKAYARMWGWDEKSIIGRTVREVIGEEGYREIEPRIQRVLKGETVTYERTIRDGEGAERVLEVNLVPQRGDDGAVMAAFVLISDITHHRSAERAVRESEERLRKLADATNEGIVFHEKGLITDCNEAMLRLVGRTQDELVGKSVLDFVAPESMETVLGHIRAGYERTYEGALLHKDGRQIPVEFTGKVMPHKGRTYRMTVVRDISDRKDAEARIHFLAHHDLLTGLPNRALLMDRLEFILGSARRRAARAGILFIDLDNFKRVNDLLGHDAGDTMLRAVAGRIEKTLRSVDVVSRLGGDEFLVVLPDLDNEQSCVQVAEKLLAAIAEPVAIEGHDLSLSVSPSIGIAVFPRDGADAETLIKNADAAMYLAKDRGRSNFQFFSERLAQAASRTLSLETRLREAILAEAFALHYQPQVRVDSGLLVGVEALIRWPQPDGSLMLPDDFIPISEQRGLIVPFGSWALRQACRQNRMWQLSGLPRVPVSVNLSAVQCKQKGFADEVEKVLAETGLEPIWLQFELNEAMLMDGHTDTGRTLAALRAIGVKIAIDDFGTGRSSLADLKRHPVDRLKIDRSFVRDMPGDKDNVAITGAIIDLARNLGITSLAEGVESQAQLQFLRERGCDEMQGFLVSPALTASEMMPFLAERRTHAAAPPVMVPRSA